MGGLEEGVLAGGVLIADDQRALPAPVNSVWKMRVSSPTLMTIDWARPPSVRVASAGPVTADTAARQACFSCWVASSHAGRVPGLAPRWAS